MDFCVFVLSILWNTCVTTLKYIYMYFLLLFLSSLGFATPGQKPHHHHIKNWHCLFFCSTTPLTSSFCSTSLSLSVLLFTSVCFPPILISCQVFFFFFSAVMIFCNVVSQLRVIRSNIISRAINGIQYLCVFYSLSLFNVFFPFHCTQNLLTSLHFILKGSSLITFRETSLPAMEQNK